MRERNDGGDDIHAVRAGPHRGDERPVDLERIDRQLGQVAQRGIAGAEVVNGDIHPQISDRLQTADIACDIVHDGAFRYLEVEGVRREPALVYGKPHDVDEVLLPQLDGGDVDRHAWRREALCL